MLAQLDRVPGVLESRVDWTGQHFLLKLGPGADPESVTSAAVSILGKEAHRLDAGLESAQVQRHRSGEPWMRAGETRRLSTEEAGVLAKRFAAAASRKAELNEDQAKRLEGVLREEIDAAFGRMHAAEAPLERLQEEYPVVLERVTARLGEFLTADQVSRVRGALEFLSRR